MNHPAPLLATALLALALGARAQERTETARWQVLLEQAVFARTYGGDEAKTAALFDQALEAARQSGDEAEQAVLRERASGPGGIDQDPGTEEILGRMLHELSNRAEPDRDQELRRIRWEDYVLDAEAAGIIAQCLDAPVGIAQRRVDLRIDDVFRIVETLLDEEARIVEAAALAHDNPLARLRAVEKGRHLDLIRNALVDPSPVVRRAACARLDKVQDPELDALFLRALDLETPAAITRCIALPGFMQRVETATPDSWLAQTLASSPYLAAGNVPPADRLRLIRNMVDWAESEDTPQSAGWLTSAAAEFDALREHVELSDDLARNIVDLAKARRDQFSTSDDDWHGPLALIIQQLGTIDDFVELTSTWIADPERKAGDFRALFEMLPKSKAKDVERLVQLGVDLSKKAAGDPRVTERLADYWMTLGRRDWRSDTTELARTLEGLTDSGLGWPMNHFVVGVAHRTQPPAIQALMEKHYAQLCESEAANDLRQRAAIALVEMRSERAPEALLALGSALPRLDHRLQSGNTLLAAFAGAPDAAARAVTQQPMRSHVTALTLPSPPQAQRWQYVIRHLREGQTYWEPPSLLWLLPPDQAAAAALELWREQRFPGNAGELADLLLFARESRYALDGLVNLFDEFADPATKAEVLQVLGEMLHRPARPLIAKALESDEPALRHAALEAAQPFIAYEQARAALRDAPQDSGR